MTGGDAALIELSRGQPGLLKQSTQSGRDRTAYQPMKVINL